MGVGVTLLYALWPLLQIRHVPPALILRMDVEPRLRGRRPWAAALPLAAGLAALALWQAGSWKIGALFAGGLAARADPPGPRRPPRHRARAPRALAVSRLAAGRGQPPPPRQPRGPGAGLARPGRDAGRLHRAARPEPARAARGPRPRQRARVLLHRHPDRPGRAVRAARGGQRRDRARRADPGGALAPRRGQRRVDRAGRARAAGGRVVPHARVRADLGQGAARAQHRRGRPLVDARGGGARAPDLGRGGDRAPARRRRSATPSPSTSRACR